MACLLAAGALCVHAQDQETKRDEVSAPPAAMGASAATESASAPASAPPASAASAPARGGVEKKFGEALVSPLADLNLVRTRIAPVLASAQSAPYALPDDTSCTALAREVELLDAVLDADLDAPASSADPTLVERGGSAAADAVIGAVRSAAEDVIPFRGWVRKITGADDYARQVSAATAAGTIRRAYLKGLGQARGCQPPAAPMRPALKEVLLPPSSPTGRGRAPSPAPACR